MLAKKPLGRTGMEVSVLGYGASELRGGLMWAPAIADEEAGKILNVVLDAGINFIDTSIDYGRSEELIGAYISSRRAEYFLASKCGCIPGKLDDAPHVHTAANIRAGVEHSLRMLKTDYLDLLQVHHSVSRQVLEAEGTIAEMLKIKAEGKTRFIGMSGTLPNIVDHLAMGVFDAFQVPYSALDRTHEDIMAQASAAEAGIIVRGGAARGAPADWGLARSSDWSAGTRKELQTTWERANLDDFLDGMDRMEFILRFTISNPDLDTAIVGTSNLDHLRDNIAAAEKGPLPDSLLEEVRKRLDRLV
jgi:aryl-alcohol dehydrogenase-like predicted oxidoreductase